MSNFYQMSKFDSLSIILIERTSNVTNYYSSQNETLKDPHVTGLEPTVTKSKIKPGKKSKCTH